MITDPNEVAFRFPRAKFGDRPRVGDFCTLGGESYQLDRSTSPRLAVFGNCCTVSSFTFVGRGTSIGNHFRADTHSYVGEDCTIGDRVVVEYGARIYDDCRIGNDVQVGGFVCNGVVVGDGSVIQGSLVHSRSASGRSGPPAIGAGVLVGAGSIVVGEVEVGDGAVIAAGAVLVQSAEPGLLYAGIPAVVKGFARWI